MQRQPKWNLADTNLANFGTKLEKEAHYEASTHETAWADGVGTQAGLWVWRIEQFQVKPWKKEHYGKFYSGDSYIVLHSYKKTKTSEVLTHDIHFWLGLESSQDEVGTAAYKTVELDDFLGGAAVQHREVQNYETPLFLSYFKRFHIEEGGIDSGFRHVKIEQYRHRLLKIKQVHRTLLIREVPKEHTSLNSGDVFVLDTGDVLYQLNGKKAQGAERVKAAEFVRAIESERNGLAKVVVIDEGDREMSRFWKALGSEGPIKPAEDDPHTLAENKPTEKKLLRIREEDGQINFGEEATDKITKSHFNSDDVYIFDVGYEVFVWIGKSSSVKEKRYALDYAQHYLEKQGRHNLTPISRVVEGGENELFEKSLNLDQV